VPLSSTFLFVHGAWHGGWCWRLVANRLRAGGHSVFTPTLTGSGERRHLIACASLDTYVTDVLDVIEWEELDDIILVGHSMAGIVVPHVAQRASDRVRRLVLLAAIVLDDGESELEAMTAEASATYLEIAARSGTDSIPLDSRDVVTALVQNAPPELQEWVCRRLTPQPVEPWRGKANLKRFYESVIPTTYIWCDQDLGMGTPGRPEDWLTNARKLERLRDFSFLVMHSDHEPMISQPDALVDLLIHLADVQNSADIRGMTRSISPGVPAFHES
jgi:pimeloyl-ACP methyl ester carboxylesterase